MTVSELFNFIKAIRPGNAFTDEQLMVWLNDIEGKVQTDIMLLDPVVNDGVNGLVSYTVADDMNTELIVPYPWSKLYRYFLLMCIDIGNAEYQRYANSYELFNEAYEEYAAWYAQHIAPANGDAIAHGYYLTAYQFAVRGGFLGTEREFEIALGNLEVMHGYCNLYDFPGDELQDKLEYALNHISPKWQGVLRIPDIIITRTLYIPNGFSVVVTGGKITVDTPAIPPEDIDPEDQEDPEAATYYPAFKVNWTNSSSARCPTFNSVVFLGNAKPLFGADRNGHAKNATVTFNGCVFNNAVLFNDPGWILQSAHFYNCKITYISDMTEANFIRVRRVTDFKMDGCVIENNRGYILKCVHDTNEEDTENTCTSAVVQNTMCESNVGIPFQFSPGRPIIVQNCYFENNQDGTILLNAPRNKLGSGFIPSFVYIHNNYFSNKNTASPHISHNYRDTSGKVYIIAHDNVYQGAPLFSESPGRQLARMGLVSGNYTTQSNNKILPSGESYWDVEQHDGIKYSTDTYDAVNHTWTIHYTIGINNEDLIPHKVYCMGVPVGGNADARGVIEISVVVYCDGDGVANLSTTVDKNIGPDGSTMSGVSVSFTGISPGDHDSRGTITFTVTGFTSTMKPRIIVPQTVPHNVYLTQDIQYVNK